MLESIFSPVLFATAFTTILVIQDPLGAIPIFLTLTGRQEDADRRRSAAQATLVSFWVILVFALFGRYILQFLGISVPALQVSGGLLLLLVALELLTDGDEEAAPSSSSTNTALVPLGTPLLAGPGAIVAAMVAVESAETPVVGWVTVALALLATHVVVWASLRYSVGLHRVLGDTAIRVLTRILGLLLAAIAVQMMGDGLVSFIKVSFL
ncbi:MULTISPECIES: MarC family protein [unclassified Actinomyces]|uniref:MarC family protein n=1 Tax=unclassified Actinomyces TaxID=2609248 RepID=UPI0020171284|nr:MULTISPECIES: MarC family protein [unclassified Actinomyces]MCL3777719.1 NAAT family transporter [Actinomyces sp. AC-20-1]MCL3789847.1 NAAT family transporter [Actinomyces sp. 187325]MCL3791519.1 NAAT family transporter [Actinomyces sp. 186855]MCL3793828.1 NAAT family transporter [Actinomyces sp. 217892]